MSDTGTLPKNKQDYLKYIGFVGFIVLVLVIYFRKTIMNQLFNDDIAIINVILPSANAQEVESPEKKSL